MNIIDLANLTTGVGELAVVCLILWESRSLGMKRPPLIWGLCAFFVIDSMIPITRSELLWGRTEHFVRATTLDIASLVVLALVVVNARRLTRAALATVNLADYKAAEYERARRDYTQVVRHRIMNPVTVILGATETLRAGALANDELANRLLTAIDESARVIEGETLMPERRDDLERELDALPRLDA